LGRETFGEVHVVSDLHLGGGQGAQIFDQGKELAGLILQLANQPASASEPLALVLNGDVVDFLAGDDALDFDPDHAVAKLDRIIADASFNGVFRALSAFLGKANHRLVVAIGNHDVELALPPVRWRLLQHLCRSPDAPGAPGESDGVDEARRGRIEFALDGTGWSANVGRTRVLVVHGNEVDDWNVVDHATLREVSEAMLAGAPYPKWRGNAGSRLVVDVMNAVKKKWPVVDLLKPEDRALVAVLTALDPSQLARLRELGPSLLRYVGQRAGRALGLLGEEGEASEAEQRQAALVYLLGGAASAPVPAPRNLLVEAEAELRRGLSPLDVAEANATGTQPNAAGAQQLGAGGMAIDLARRRSPEENLREALGKWLRWDVSFAPGTKDDTFEQLDRSVSRDIGVVIAGHTHLERAIARDGGGVYFNSGTWARLIQLAPAVLDDATAFAKVYAAFARGTLAALDQLPGLVLRRPTLVSVWREGESTLGELRRVRLDASVARLEPVPETRLMPRV
jgi:UDP-2,3-diacylglucosamine pyrophosphatase LpxH